MKLSYEPNLAAGGIMGALMALAVYYKILDWEAAGLWSVVIAGLAPIVQGYIARFFTTPTAKLDDAAVVDGRFNTEAINHAARKGRAVKSGNGDGAAPSV